MKRRECIGCLFLGSLFSLRERESTLLSLISARLFRLRKVIGTKFGIHFINVFYINFKGL